MYSKREIYPNAPLALVVAQVKYAYAPRLRQRDTLDQVALALEQDLPVVNYDQSLNISLTSGQFEGHAELAQRHLNRESTTSVHVTPTALTLETTAYVEFGEFADLFSRACAALADAGAVHAVERIGLRYVDEVRVPDQISDARDWRGWVADELVAHLSVASQAKALGSEALVQYDLGDQIRLAFRFGARDGKPVVGSQLLRRPVQYEPGPFFVIDLDGFRQQPADEGAVFDVEWIRAMLETVHGPAGEAFQNSITDQSRAVFREER